MSVKNLGVTKTQDKIGHALYNMRSVTCVSFPPKTCALFSLVPTDILDEGKNVALKNKVEPLTTIMCYEYRQIT